MAARCLHLHLFMSTLTASLQTPTASRAVPGVDLRFFFFHFFISVARYFTVGQSLVAMNSMAGVQ